jgi:hypothetical protein
VVRCFFLHLLVVREGARGSVVVWGTMLQARRPWTRFQIRSLEFFNLPNPSSLTMALGSTQPLTEISTRDLSGGKGFRHLRLTTSPHFCDTIVWKMWGPRRLTTLRASTPCHRDSLARKADKFTAICEPIVHKMWEPRRLTTLRDSMVCHRDSSARKADNLTATCEPDWLQNVGASTYHNPTCLHTLSQG